MRRAVVVGLVAVSSVLAGAPSWAQAAEPPAAPSAAIPGYRIGADDVLDIAFWQDKDLSGEVVVRPDGNIALPVLGEVAAAGRTPAELTARLKELAAEFLEQPLPTVTVKQINSRKVFITGEVAKPGRYPLVGSTTVLELIAMAGGLNEYADRKNIGIVRKSSGGSVTFKFNYKKAEKLQDLHENIELLPGDIVMVP